jgi:hypothetical protein
MQKPFRSTLSNKTIAEIKAKMGLPGFEGRPRLQRVFEWYSAILALFLASFWVCMFAAAPLLVMLALFNGLNWTVEWLMLAAGGFLVSLVLVAGLPFLEIFTDEQQPGARKQSIHMLVGITGLVLLLVLLGWWIIDRSRPPLSITEQARLVCACILGVGFLMWAAVSEVRTYGWRSRSTLLRFIGYLLLSITIIIFFAGQAFALQHSLWWEMVDDIRFVAQIAGFSLLGLVRKPDASPSTPRSFVTHLTISGLLIGGVVLIMFVG